MKPAFARSMLLLMARVAIFVAIAMQVSVRPAAAWSSPWELCEQAGWDRWHIQEWTSHFYWGIFGWFYTYQPYVRSIDTDFSLSHFYPHTDGGAHFVEVGWYRGYGWQKNVSVSSYYSAGEDSVTPYDEHDGGAAPDASYLVYEAQYEGYDYGTNKNIWRVYAGTLSTPLDTWENKDLGSAIGLSGGEYKTTQRTATGIEVHVRSIPHVQLRLQSTTSWNDWTETFMAAQGDSVRTCETAYFDFVYNSKFQDYQISGTAQ